MSAPQIAQVVYNPDAATIEFRIPLTDGTTNERTV